MKEFANSDKTMDGWHKQYLELREATKHIKPIKKHVFAGLRNPIRVKKDVV